MERRSRVRLAVRGFSRTGFIVAFILSSSLFLAPGAGALTFTQDQGNQTSAAPPEGYTPEPVTPSVGGSDVLLIKDVNPWGYPANERALQELGISYDVVNSGMLATTDLSAYKVVIIASDQYTSTYNNNLIANKAKLEDYVYNGRVLVAHACDVAWHRGHWASSFLPLGIYHGHHYYNYLTIIDPTSPIVNGTARGGAVSDPDLDRWYYSTHGYFTSLPDTHKIIGVTYDPFGNPTYIEYAYGSGRVLATMQTIEWPWACAAIYYCAGEAWGPLWKTTQKNMLRNEIEYALSLAAICPAPPPVNCTLEEPCDILDPSYICPADANVTVDSYGVDPDKTEYCNNESITIWHTRQGSYIDVQESNETVCYTDCQTECTTANVVVQMQECYQKCIQRCANGVCIRWETVCNLTENATYWGNQCFYQCNATYDNLTRTAYYNRSCGFNMEDVIDIRVSNGMCTGRPVNSYNLSGAGTGAIKVPVPMLAGSYDICVNSKLVKTIKVLDCGPACTVNIPRNTFVLDQGIDGYFEVELSNYEAGGTYYFTLERWEDAERTIPMTVPAFLQVSPSLFVGVNATAPFNITAINPQPEDNITHWGGVILKAEGPATCEAFFDVDVIPDLNPPSVTANPTGYPVGQTAAKYGDVITLNATIVDAQSGVRNSSVDASLIGAGTITLMRVVGTDYWVNDSVVVNTTATGTFYLDVMAYDNAFNANDTEQLEVVVDNIRLPSQR